MKGIAGSDPGPRCAMGELLAQKSGDTALPGFALGPRCAMIHCLQQAVVCQSGPGFVPRPRCAPVFESSLLVGRGRLPGLVPGPRCACVAKVTPVTIRSGVAGPTPLSLRCAAAVHREPALVGIARSWPRPSLREVRHAALGGPGAGRCRGPAPTLVERKSWRTRTSGSSSALPGFGPGPRCTRPSSATAV